MAETDSLGEIRHRINAGDRDGAKLALVEHLKAEPDNADGWALLAILLKEPAEQADCYRQVLRIEPDNRQAAAWLEALTAHLPDSAAQEAPSEVLGITLQCAQCGGVTEVRFVGKMRDKRAFCPHCGAQIDLPDTFQRVERRREHEQGPLGESGIEESVVIETRRDHVSGGQLPSDVDDLDEILQALDLPDTEEGAMRDLRERDSVAELTKQVTVSSTSRVEEQEFLDRIMRQEGGGDALDGEIRALLGDQQDATSKPGQFSPEVIIQLAGGPLPPEERRKCHNCGAVISRSDTRCPWCSAPLPASGDE